MGKLTKNNQLRQRVAVGIYFKRLVLGASKPTNEESNLIRTISDFLCFYLSFISSASEGLGLSKIVFEAPASVWLP